MPTTRAALHINGLGKQKIVAIFDRAKRLGMTPQQYVKHLVEEDLAIERLAKTKTFKELLGPGEKVDEAELDRLVEDAREEYYQRRTSKAQGKRP